MPWVIDGSNLGGELGGAAGARDRVAVLHRVLPWARRRGRVVLVFDGPAEATLAERYGPLELLFAGAASADQSIQRLIGRQPRQWQVVTADRALAAACSERGARVVAPDELLARIDAAPPPSATGEAPVDVADWQRWFDEHRK